MDEKDDFREKGFLVLLDWV